MKYYKFLAKKFSFNSLKSSYNKNLSKENIQEKEQKIKILKSLFDSNKEILILKVDKLQGIYLLLVFFMNFSITNYILYKLYKNRTEMFKGVVNTTKSIFSIIFSGFFFILGLKFLKGTDNFIRRIYLKQCGEKIRVCTIFSSKIIDIKNFKKILPGDKTILEEAYKTLLLEGYPVNCNGKVKIISRYSTFYYKQILNEIGKSKYIEVVESDESN